MSRIIKVLALFAALFAFTTGTSYAAAQEAEPVQAAASLGAKIASIAERELKDKTRNHEEGAANCNFYSGQAGSGSTKGCKKGWRAEAWCADFLKYVWKQAGAKTSGITPAAASLYKYGKTNKTWNSGSSIKGVKVGDAVVYNLNSGGTYASHVGIVTKVNTKTGKITVISGNSGTGSKYVDDRTFTPDGTVSGYASPVD
ncbi:CHAP domain-containing protein [Saccharothrix obliqua]|uniref:CHAP domain-containing protein n=1 Tax=Saccharothrix obliqua TaxID=2861747 RepID=UPI001C600929|nr:CHAP domain-containing protein [Saccharothrix obliqua]MBW4722171.1 CHAP domain-containing protein [Saccharothrix obliqua]